MGSDESHFNVSVGSDGQSHKTVSTNHNLFEEEGEPKRYRTEVLPLTSLTPYRRAKPAHNQSLLCFSLLVELLPSSGAGSACGGLQSRLRTTPSQQMFWTKLVVDKYTVVLHA